MFSRIRSVDLIPYLVNILEMLLELQQMLQASAAFVCRFQVRVIQAYRSHNAGRLYYNTPRHNNSASAISIY
jgi:hypothetical protein